MTRGVEEEARRQGERVIVRGRLKWDGGDVVATAYFNQRGNNVMEYQE